MNIDNKNISNFNLMITNQCNCNCSYCFEKHKNEKMNLNIMKKSFDIIFDCPKNEIGISYFGGEPTLEENLLVKGTNYLIKKINDNNKIVNFLLYTNGTIFLENFSNTIKKLVNHKNIRSVKIQVSYEGDENDFKDYKTIEKNILKYVELKNNYDNFNKMQVIIRSTFSDKNFKRSETLINLFDFAIKSGVSLLSIHPIAEAEWTDKHLYLFENAISIITQKLIDFYSDKKNKLFIFYPLSLISLKNKGPILCNAGANYIFIDVDGTIYPCQRLSPNANSYDNDPENILGTVFDEFKNIKATDKISKIKQPDICKDCEVYDCEFCPPANYLLTGNYNGIVNLKRCEIKKMFFSYRKKMLKSLKEKNINNDLIFEEECVIEALILIQNKLAEYFNKEKFNVIFESYDYSLYTITDNIFNMIKEYFILDFLPLSLNYFNYKENFNKIFFILEKIIIELINKCKKKNYKIVKNNDDYIVRITRILYLLMLLEE